MNTHTQTINSIALVLLAVFLGLSLFFMPSAQAANYSWNTTGTNNWSDAHWTPSGPPSSADIAVFNLSGVNGAEAAQLSGATVIGGLVFNNTGTTLIDASAVGTQTLTLGTSGITINAGAGAVTIGNGTNIANINLAGSQIWTNNSGAMFTVVNTTDVEGYALTISGNGNTSINGTIQDSAGGGSLIKNGNGMLTLAGVNGNGVFAVGNIYLNTGILQATNSQYALGGGTGLYPTVLNLAGGMLQLTNATGYGINDNTLVSGNNVIFLDRGAAGAGVTNTLGTLGIGNQTLTVVGGGATTSGNAGLIFGATTLSGTSTLFQVVNLSPGSGNTYTSSLTLGAITVSGGGNSNIVKGGNGNLTFNGSVANGTGGFTQYSSTAADNRFTGTTTFNGADSGTGAVKIYGGIVTLTNGSGSFASTDVELLGGVLNLGASGDAFRSTFLNSSAALVMGGGRLVDGATTGSGTQTIASLALRAGDSAFTGAGAATHTLLITSNSITRDLGSIINFDEGANFKVVFGSQPTLTNGILGGWATAGTDFATATSGTVGALATYDSTNINSVASTYNVSATTTNTTVSLLASSTLNALKITSVNNTVPSTLNLGGNTLTIASGGLITNASSANGYANSIINGTLTSGSTAGAELFVISAGANGIATNIAATIANNAGGAVSLVRGGNANSNLFLSGENTYTGQTILGMQNGLQNTLAEYGNSPQANVNILTERQLGAMPAPGATVTNDLVLNNGSIQFVGYVNPSWAPERGINLGGLGGELSINLNVAFNTYAFNLAAPISGTGPLWLNMGYQASAPWTLSGNNTFDGPINISSNGQSGAVVNYTSIGNVGGTTATALGQPSNASNGLIRDTKTPLYYVGLGAQSSNRDFQILGGVTLGAVGSGPITLSGNEYLLSGAAPSFAGTGFGVFSGNIIQGDTVTTSNLNVSGGSWQLSGQNTFTGTVGVSGNSVLEFTTIGNVGSGPSSLGAPTTVLNGTIGVGGVNYSFGWLRFVGSTSQSSDRNISSGAYSSVIDASGINGAILTLTGSVTNTGGYGYVLQGSGTGIASGLVSSTGISKSGPGTWIFNGSTTEAYTGKTSIGGGNLILDFSNMATPTNLINSTSPLVLGFVGPNGIGGYTGMTSGGALTIIGKSGQAVAQTFGALTVSANTGSQINLNTSGAAASVSATTAAVGVGAGATLDIETNGTASLYTGAITLVNGLLPYATYSGTTFATGVAAGGVISAYTGYTGPLPATGVAYTSSYTLTTGTTLTGDVAFTGLQITPGSDGQTLNLGGHVLSSDYTHNTLIGLIYNGGPGAYTYTISNGQFASNMDKVVSVSAGTLNISANLYSGPSGGSLDKAGVGTLMLSGNNTGYTGATNVNWGTLKAGSTTAFSPSSAFTIGQSGTLSLNGFSNTIYSLTGIGQIINGSNSSPAALTIQNSTSSNTGAVAFAGTLLGYFNGTIADGGSQPLSLVLNSSRTLLSLGLWYNGNSSTTWPLFSNTGNSFTGNVSILSGCLWVSTLTNGGVNGPLGAGTGIVLGSSSNGVEGILGYAGHNGSTDRTITLQSGGAGGFQLSDSGNGAASNMFGATVTLTGTVTGGGTLDKLESGNLVLTNPGNNFTGGAIVRSGILQFASGALPSTGSITVVPGGTVSAAWNFGNSDFLNHIATNSVGVVALGANNNSALDFTNYPGLSLGANNQSQSFLGSIIPNGSTYRLGGGGVTSSLMIQNANTLTSTNSVVISNAGSLGGTVVFSDAQNYSGATSITPGFLYTAASAASDPTVTLILAGQNASIANSSAINLNPSGVLRIVDSVGAAAKFGASAPFNFNGGTLQYYNDGSNGTFTQSVGNLNLNLGANYVVVNGASTGGTAALTFSGLTRTAGSTIDFNVSAAYSALQQVVITGHPTLGAWATFGAGTGFAAYDATKTSNVIMAAETTITALTGVSSSTYYNTATATLASGFGSVSLNTLRNTAASIISMASGDTINANAFMANGGALTIGNTAGTGTVTTSGSELFFYTPSKNITVNANISAGSNTLVKSGASTLTLASTGVNSYGGLVINQGTVVISATAALASGANVTLNGNGATLNISVTGTYNNPLTVNGDSFVPTASGVTLGFSGNIVLNNNASLDFQGPNSSPVSLIGAISGTGGLIFENNSTGSGNAFVFANTAGSNTYTGLTQILGQPTPNFGAAGQLVTLQNTVGVAIPGNILLGKRGTLNNTVNQYNEILRIGNSFGNQIADSSLITFAGGNSTEAGIFQLYSYNETIGAIQSQGPGDGVIENGNTGTSTLTLADSTSSDTYTFSGLLRDGPGGTLALVKNGAYTQVLVSPNFYTGATTLSGGTLSTSLLANGGVASNIGASTNVAANLVFNGGALQYTGGMASTDRLFTLNAGGGTIDASGSGALTFSNTGAIATSGAGTLTLTGTSNALNTFTPAIGGSASVTKTGAGTWVMASTSASNNYTGATTVSGGKLVVSGSISGSVTTVNGGVNTTLGGTGVISQNVILTLGRIAPGLNNAGTNNNFGVAGTLSLGTIGGLTLTNANIDFDLATTVTAGAGVNDLIATGGVLTLGSSVAFNFSMLGASLNTTTPYTLISGASSVAGFNATTLAAATTGLAGSYTPTYSVSGNNLVVQFAAIPEPQTWVMLISGIGMLSLLRRRRA